MNTKNRGFTFVEVLIAILIMGIVGGTAIHLFGLSQMFVDRQISSAVRLNAERFTIDSIYAELHKGSLASIDILSTESPLVNDAVSNYKYIFRNNNGHVILREWSADAGGAGVGASVDRQLLGAEGVQSLMFSILSDSTAPPAENYMLSTNVIAHGVTRPEEGIERTISRRIGLLGRPAKGDRAGTEYIATRSGNTYTGSAVRFAFFVAPDTVLEPAPVHHVTATGAGTQDGTSWADAMSSVQTAVTAATTSKKEVWVAAGTYSGAALGRDTGDGKYTLILSKDVKLYGGFLGYENWSSDRNYTNTILSGDNQYRVISLVGPSNNAQSTNRPNSIDTIIDGFTITGGSADNGAGLFLSYASPTIANCIFSGDIASGNGGGIYNLGASPIVSNCTFLNNTAKYGGGMYIDRADNGNSAYSASTVTMTSCDFSTNSSSGNGGGIYINSSSAGSYLASVLSTVVITSCDFLGNKTSGDGGGMYISDTNTRATMTGSTFDNNISETTTNGGGGGIFKTTYSVVSIDISAFLRNEAVEYGGGIRNSGGGTLTITRSTFSGNKTTASPGTAGGGGIFNINSPLTIINSTFSKNEANVGSTFNTSGGGAIHHTGATGYSHIINCTFSENKVIGSTNNLVGGGAIYNRGATGTVIRSINTIFWNNTNEGTRPKNVYNSETMHLTNCILASGDITGSSSITSDEVQALIFLSDLNLSFISEDRTAEHPETHYYVPVQSDEVRGKGVATDPWSTVPPLTALNDDQLGKLWNGLPDIGSIKN